MPSSNSSCSLFSLFLSKGHRPPQEEVPATDPSQERRRRRADPHQERRNYTSYTYASGTTGLTTFYITVSFPNCSTSVDLIPKPLYFRWSYSQTTLLQLISYHWLLYVIQKLFYRYQQLIKLAKHCLWFPDSAQLFVSALYINTACGGWWPENEHSSNRGD